MIENKFGELVDIVRKLRVNVHGTTSKRTIL